MNVQTKFLSEQFEVSGSDKANVPGFKFFLPAGQAARLRLELLYSAPPDVDAIVSLNATHESFEFVSMIRDGAHNVQQIPDQNPDGPQNFNPIIPLPLGDIEAPGRGVLLRRDAVLVDYQMIGGSEDLIFTVQFSQKGDGKLASYLHWGFAEFKSA